jgi:hypothetical protein
VRRKDRTLITGFVFSLLAHVVAAVALVGGLGGRPSVPDPDSDRRLKMEEQRVETPRVTLGLDSSKAATITWIGYDEYQEHQARQADVEQAALEFDPGEAGSASGIAMPPEPAAVAQAEPKEAQTPTEGQTVDLPMPALRSMTLEAAEQANAITERMLRIAEQIAEAASTAEQQNAPSDTAQPEAVAESQKPAAQATETPPQPSLQVPGEEEQTPKPGQASAGDGAAADKDSDPTSKLKPVKVANWGKPLAANGLEIKTRKPEISHLTRWTSAPRNPVVVIDFARDGTVHKARFMTVKKDTFDTGDSRINKAVIAALYRWRASGKVLLELPEDDPEASIPVVFELVFSRY